ncbi:Myosin V [Gigaspora margarita]|uniref:Myosin V n=1 Tax=Gigaspora margarita TaxID=4874 RepID=A0A8H3XBP3_GIGMA|nr:Myosin V [Gigaspora margarita]
MTQEFFEKLEADLKSHHRKTFDYSQFEDLNHIGTGGFADVYSATFNGETYALKILKNNLKLEEFKTFRHEIKCLYTVDHQNIIKFHGISKGTEGNFILVLQYANGGSLREHLRSKQKDGLYKILWNDLIQIAKEITLGLAHLHSKNIVHRDLHSMNILINDNRALITDFGISKQLDAVTTATSTKAGVIGIPAYIEPQCFIQYKEAYKIDKKSDIYSLGVLFWELTSGTPPFYNFIHHVIPMSITHGVREKAIENTPLNYVSLFQKCWSTEPAQRPSLDQVLDELNKLLTENTVEFVVNRIDRGSKNILAEFNISAGLVSFTNGIETEDFSNKMPTAIIEEIIPEIKTFDYKEFSEHHKIGEGRFGVVYEAKWQDHGSLVVLKKFSEHPHETVGNPCINLFEQIEHIIRVSHHDNIIRFFGITQDPKAETYYMVLQLANKGDLRCYLSNNFLKLNWINKIRMAKEISSDIYSLGVLFWELSSGVPPFKNKSDPKEIPIYVINGGRETPIDGTPVYFMNIYFDAWDGDPNLRPSIAKICKKLNNIRMDPVYHCKQEISDPATTLKLKQEIATLREQLAKVRNGVNNVTQPSSHRPTENGFLTSAEKPGLRPASISTTHVSIPNINTPGGRVYGGDEPEEQIMKLLEDDEALEDEIINRLIKSLKIPLPNSQNPPYQKEILFPARIISLIAKQMWKYGFIKESERLFANVMKTIQEHVMYFKGDDAILPGAYWLSNVHELLSFVTAAEKDMLRGVDLVSDSSGNVEWHDYERLVSIVKNDLESLEYNIYHTWMKQLKERLYKMIIPALIESQSLPGFITSESNRFLQKFITGPVAPAFSMDDLLNFLNKVWEAMKSYYLEMSIIQQVVTELLKLIGVTSFNDLLMRRNFCSWKRAMQIQYNITLIEEWCKLHEMPEGTLQLEHLMQGTKLLQLKKATLGDVEIIYDVCWMLTPSQIQKLISHYFVADYENPISPEILKAVASRVTANDRKDILLLDTTPLEDSGPFEVPLPREVHPPDNYVPAWLDLPHIRRLGVLSI